MGFIEYLKWVWRGRPRIKHHTHLFTAQWTPISHNEPLRKTCGFVPPTPGYAPCTREPHSSGPCAHPLLDEVIRWDVGLTPDGFPEIDALAQRLHREYRATSKALKGTAKHDHGWKHCRAKRYFWNRARQWRRDSVAKTADKALSVSDNWREQYEG
jgi:hypothetical protein